VSRTETVAQGLAGVSIASRGDTVRLVGEVLAPLVARGLLIRRPRVVAMADRLDLDRRAVRRLQAARARYGSVLLRLRIPGRSVALVLDPAAVRRILDGSPEPFALASREKRAALAHFQPGGVLASSGRVRSERRVFNEAVLDTGRPVHGEAGRFLEVVAEEAGALRAEAVRAGELTWDRFAPRWFRLVRRLVLGDRAAEDDGLTDLLASLRADANWAYLRPRRTGRREALARRIQGYLDDPGPGSLAARAAAQRAGAEVRPGQQVPQWLFAFDAAGMATLRALALLAAHPDEADVARRERAARPPADLPFHRACVLESVRLWPTTPAVLRDTTVDTDWEGDLLPAGTALVIHVPFLHRDGHRLAAADRFAPRLWSDGAAEAWPLIPFSAGPGECPGRNLVLLVSGAVLATLAGDGPGPWLLPPDRLDAGRPLPATLDPFALRFRYAD
jgi:cytochrome P450